MNGKTRNNKPTKTSLCSSFCNNTKLNKYQLKKKKIQFHSPLNFPFWDSYSQKEATQVNVWYVLHLKKLFQDTVFPYLHTVCASAMSRKCKNTDDKMYYCQYLFQCQFHCMQLSWDATDSTSEALHIGDSVDVYINMSITIWPYENIQVHIAHRLWCAILSVYKWGKAVQSVTFYVQKTSPKWHINAVISSLSRQYVNLKRYFLTRGLCTHTELEIWGLLYIKANVFHLSSVNALHLSSLQHCSLRRNLIATCSLQLICMAATKISGCS